MATFDLTTANDLFFTGVERQLLKWAGTFGGLNGLFMNVKLELQGGSYAKVIPILDETTAQEVAGSGTALTFGATSTTSGVTVTASMVGSPFILDKMAVKLGQDDYMSALGQNGAKAIAKYQETDLMALNSSINSTTGTSATTANTAAFLSALYKIRASGFINDNIVAALHPFQKRDLDKALSTATGVVNAPLNAGFFQQPTRQLCGSLYGVPVYLSTAISIVLNGSDCAGALFVKQDQNMEAWACIGEAWSLDMRQWVQNGQDYMQIDSAYGVKELRAAAACQFVSMGS